MIDDDYAALPRDVEDYNERQAAHLRALAGQATTTNLKRLLLKKAEEHERRAQRGVDAS